MNIQKTIGWTEFICNGAYFISFRNASVGCCFYFGSLLPISLPVKANLSFKNRGDVGDPNDRLLPRFLACTWFDKPAERTIRNALRKWKKSRRLLLSPQISFVDPLWICRANFLVDHCHPSITSKIAFMPFSCLFIVSSPTYPNVYPFSYYDKIGINRSYKIMPNAEI